MEMDEILAAQMSAGYVCESDMADDVDPSSIAGRIDMVQPTAEKLRVGTNYPMAILRRFIDHGVITPNGEILIEWLEAGPSSPDRAIPIPEDWLLRRIAELPDAICWVGTVRSSFSRIMLKKMLSQCRQQCTGSQALLSLEQEWCRRESQGSSDRNVLLAPPAPFFSITASDAGRGRSDGRRHFPGRTSTTIEHGLFYKRKRAFDFTEPSPSLPSRGGLCGMSDIMEE